MTGLPALIRRATKIAVVLGMMLITTGVAQAEPNKGSLSVPTAPEGNQACLECHAKAEKMTRAGVSISIQVDPKAYGASVHGIISCARCHAEAGPEHAADPKKPLALPTGRELATLKSEGCVKCHAGLYGQSYEQSFHGIAVKYGDLRAATCVDCHGVHNILPSRDPASSVAKGNLAKTCATTDCHPGAPESFADGKEHFVAAQESAGTLHWVYKAFIGLILFDTLKDGPIVMFELLRRLMH